MRFPCSTPTHIEFATSIYRASHGGAQCKQGTSLGAIAQRSDRVKGRTSLEHDGKSVSIATQTFVGVAKSTRRREGAVIGGAAGVGAAIGAIGGGGKGAATGTAIVSAGGTGTVLAMRGDDVYFPPESRLRFVIINPIDL